MNEGAGQSAISKIKSDPHIVKICGSHHLEFLNSNISLMNGRQVLIFQLGPNISVI